MIQNIQKYDSINSDSIKFPVCKIDTLTLPLSTPGEEPLISKSVEAQYNELVQEARAKIPGIKTNFITSWLDMNKDTKEELGKLIDDEQLHTKIKDYIDATKASDLKKMLNDKRHQENLINMVIDYTKNNDYPHTTKFLSRGIIQKGVKSYLADL